MTTKKTNVIFLRATFSFICRCYGAGACLQSAAGRLAPVRSVDLGVDGRVVPADRVYPAVGWTVMDYVIPADKLIFLNPD